MCTAQLPKLWNQITCVAPPHFLFHVEFCLVLIFYRSNPGAQQYDGIKRNTEWSHVETVNYFNNYPPNSRCYITEFSTVP